MDLMLQISEEVEEQWSNEQRQQEESIGDAPFRSVYTINGTPILPPLMTPERRVEMQELRQAAMAIEKQLGSELKFSYRQKCRKRWLNSDCCQFVDASTSTDPQLPQQPVVIAGRLKQQLQLSETLIYDNNRNAIIKFVKQDEMNSMLLQSQLLLEEWPEMRAQMAVIKEECPKFATGTISTIEEQSQELELETETDMEAELETELETDLDLDIETETEFTSESTSEPAVPIEELERTIETPRKPTAIGDDNAIKDLIGVARKLKENLINTERELRRSYTSPFIHSKDSAIKDNDSSSCHKERSERLHPQLWKRYHSYPFGTHCKPSDCAAPTSPNVAATQETHLPTAAPPSTPITPACSKIQIKQRMAPEDQQAPVDGKLKSKVLSGSQQKLVASRTSKKTPRASSSVSYAAHATSHAKVEGCNNDGNTRISSTQRRLSYDPRATLKRATSLRKAATVNSSSSNSSQATAVQPVLAAGSNQATELLKRKMLDEMEQQQRHRFHQLVSQQADEQQRMQLEFQSQQQLLMEQMLADMSSYTFDKFEAVDQPDSDSSSIASLPQSRLDLDINDEPKSSGM